jgi:protein SERAC1
VVPQDSAILPGYIPIGIRSNHMDMTKFETAEDPGFISLCGELRRWIKEAEMLKRRHKSPSQLDPSSGKEDWRGNPTVEGE